MRRNYDIFEKFSDGSTLWRACVPGWFEAQRKMEELTKHSENEFCAIDILANQPIASNVKIISRATAKSAEAG
jgi:hypothetical protein